MGKLIGNLDTEHIMQNELFEDMPHPTDSNRTLLKDSQSRLESYFAKKEK
jgi:hypothetical protein